MAVDKRVAVDAEGRGEAAPVIIARHGRDGGDNFPRIHRRPGPCGSMWRETNSEPLEGSGV